MDSSAVKIAPREEKVAEVDVVELLEAERWPFADFAVHKMPSCSGQSLTLPPVRLPDRPPSIATLPRCVGSAA